MTTGYDTYCKMVAVQTGRFSAERLPPTQDAAEMHVMPVHLQAVLWASFGHNAACDTL